MPSAGPAASPLGRDREPTLTDGERWAREQLSLLLARRFAPVAAARFIRDSWRRSADVRRERTALARRARRWMAAGGLAWVALAVGGVEPFRRRTRDGLAWWLTTALMLDWHLGMVETADGRPRNLGAADALTLARAWLVPVAFDTPAPLVCLLAAATDTLDGPLARRAGPTRAGRDLEGLVDACFAAAALRGALRHGWLPAAVAGAELLRVGAGIGYAFAVYFGRARPPRPDLLRAARATTALRATGLALAGTPRHRAAATLIAIGSTASIALVAAAAAGWGEASQDGDSSRDGWAATPPAANSRAAGRSA